MIFLNLYSLFIINNANANKFCVVNNFEHVAISLKPNLKIIRICCLFLIYRFSPPNEDAEVVSYFEIKYVLFVRRYVHQYFSITLPSALHMFIVLLNLLQTLQCYLMIIKVEGLFFFINNYIRFIIISYFSNLIPKNYVTIELNKNYFLLTQKRLVFNSR